MNAEISANDTDPRGYAKARQLQRALYLAAKRSTTRRFHALYDKLSQWHILQTAWVHVQANNGAPGVDRETLEMIAREGVDDFLREIQRGLQAGTYRPLPVRRVYIPKPDGRQRPLGIPAIRDRIVQMAAKLVLEPIFEADFLGCSYGFRPKRSAHQAIEAIRQAANAGSNWVVDFDIVGFFDNINNSEEADAVGRAASQ